MKIEINTPIKLKKVKLKIKRRHKKAFTLLDNNELWLPK